MCARATKIFVKRRDEKMQHEAMNFLKDIMKPGVAYYIVDSGEISPRMGDETTKDVRFLFPCDMCEYAFLHEAKLKDVKVDVDNDYNFCCPCSHKPGEHSTFLYADNLPEELQLIFAEMEFECNEELAEVGDSDDNTAN